LPLYRLLATDVATLQERAADMVASAGSAKLEVGACEAVTGGGSLPSARIPSVAVTAAWPSVDQVASALRRRTPPVLARVQDERIYFDLKTVFPDQDQELARAIADAGSQ
jgi:L-seryl-tRNA(Ser) seleniumtransferase